MPSPDNYDVAIIGAGPAGSSAAWHLANAGCRTIVLERAAWPRLKVCGGGLIARAQRELPPGVVPPVRARCHGVGLDLPQAGLSLRTRRDEAVVSMVMREELDSELMAAATQQGCHFRDACRLEGLHQDGDGTLLETSSGQLRATLVIAADGVRSRTAELAGFSDGRTLIPAIEWEVPADERCRESFADTALFDFGVITDGYAWIFPKGDHLSVGLGTMRARARDLPGTLARYLERKGISSEGTLSRRGHQIPLTPRRTPCASNRVLLTGDAAGFVDPVTAEGLTYALSSGRMAAQACLAGELQPQRVVTHYLAAINNELLPELRYGRWLATLLYRLPKVRDRFFIRHGQRLAERMTDVVMGKTSYREVIRRSGFWMRLLR